MLSPRRTTARRPLTFHMPDPIDSFLDLEPTHSELMSLAGSRPLLSKDDAVALKSLASQHCDTDFMSLSGSLYPVVACDGGQLPYSGRKVVHPRIWSNLARTSTATTEAEYMYIPSSSKRGMFRRVKKAVKSFLNPWSVSDVETRVERILRAAPSRKREGKDHAAQEAASPDGDLQLFELLEPRKRERNNLGAGLTAGVITAVITHMYDGHAGRFSRSTGYVTGLQGGLGTVLGVVSL